MKTNYLKQTIHALKSVIQTFYMPLKGALQLSKAYYMAKDMAARTRLIKLHQHFVC